MFFILSDNDYFFGFLYTIFSVFKLGIQLNTDLCLTSQSNLKSAVNIGCLLL